MYTCTCTQSVTHTSCLICSMKLLHVSLQIGYTMKPRPLHHLEPHGNHYSHPRAKRKSGYGFQGDLSCVVANGFIVLLGIYTIPGMTNQIRESNNGSG